MNKLTDGAIDLLAQHDTGHVLSIYMPTHQSPTPPNISENQIRYKNLLRKGFEQYRQRVSEHDLKQVEDELVQKVDDLHFWQEMSRSLALFIRPDGYEYYHLPVEMAEQVYAGETYDIIPLLHIRTTNQPFYILALALHEPKLFKGDMYGLSEVAIEFPTSPEAALNIDEMFINSNTRRAGSGSLLTNPHGQGDSNRAGEEERLMYWRIIDKKIQHSKLFDDGLPILLAGTQDDVAEFRALTGLKGIVERSISGNRTKEDLVELHTLSFEMLSSTILSDQSQKSAAEFSRSIGSQKAATDAADIEQAAKDGRIEKLLLCVLRRTHDSLGSKLTDTLRLDIPQDTKAGLLKLVARVRNSGGRVEILSPQLMPEPIPLAAVYRY